MRRLAERPGMFAADDGFVGIVIKIDQLLAPTDPDRLQGGQHDPDRHLQTLRPGVGRPKGCPAPVVTSHEAAQFTASCQEITHSRAAFRRDGFP